MIRIMFIGSIPDHVPGTNQKIKKEHKPLFTAARELGMHAAESGHRVLLGSSSPRSIDLYVAQGVKDFCMAHPERTGHIELHRPENEPTMFEDMPENVHFLPYAHHVDPNSSHKWIIAHVRATDCADVLITMAGSTSTRLVGYLAAERGKSVIAIPSFGGASEHLFQTLKYAYRDLGIEAAELQSLLGSWQPKSAEKVIELACQLHAKGLTIPHSYFISYSWTDCAVADHVETLLRRENRPILRDEADLQAGGRISKKVESLIENCDTFLALWSKHYNSSSWCPQELEYTVNLQKSGGKPRRIVLLRLDDTKLPLRQTDNLYEQGQSRKDRELAVLKLIRRE